MISRLVRGKGAKRHSRRFIKFCLAGLVSAFFDIGILATLVEVFDWNILLSNGVAFFVAVFVSYFLNKYWTFRDTEKVEMKQFSIFFSISFVGFILNEILLFIALGFDIWYVFAKIVIIGLVAIWNYSANHIWTFHTHKEYEENIDNHSSL